MTWTNTSAFSSYILTFVHGDEAVVEGAHRPRKGAAEITPGGIVIPVYDSGTVENVSTTTVTAIPNNTLVTLTQFDKRAPANFKRSEWKRFQDDPDHRMIVAEGQGRDLVEQILIDFYAVVVDEGNATSVGTTPSGDVLTQNILAKMATVKSRSRAGKATKITIFLNESGAAAFAMSNRAAFNYAPSDPFFGTFLGAKVWTTNDDLSGSGTVIGGVFGEMGIAYAAAEVITTTSGDQPENLTGMHTVNSTASYGIKSLNTDMLHHFVTAPISGS